MTGSPVTPLPVEEWSEQAKEVLPGFLRRPELYLSGDADAQPMPQALRMFANHVELGAAWMTFTEMLAGADSTLDPRLRELAILRVAWKTSSEYEWKQHVRIGSRAGITTEQLYEIPAGADADVWTPLERSVLEAVDQIIDSRRVKEGTRRALAEHFDAAQLLEMLFVIGGYVCFATVANSVDLPVDPATENVDAPELPSGARSHS